MAKLCMYNDCQAGEHEYSIRCCDCPETDALRDARIRTARVAIG